MSKISIFIFILLMSTQGMSQTGWDLERCIRYAVENNVDVQSQELQNMLNKLDHNQAKKNALPNLNANVTHGYNWGQRIDPFTNQFASDRVRNNNLNLSSDVLLYGGMRINNQKRQAILSYDAGVLDAAQLSNNISIQVAQAYLANLLAQERLQIAQNQRLITVEQVDRINKLVDAGQEPKSRLYEIEAQLSEDDLRIVRVENEIILSNISLVNLLQLKGEEAAAFNTIAPASIDGKVEMPTIDADGLYLSALEILPEVKSARIMEERSELEILIANSYRLPELSLFGSIGSGYSGANQVGVGNSTASFVPLGQVGIGGVTVFSLQERVFYDDFEPKSFGDQLDQNFNQSIGFNLNIPIFNNSSAKIASKKAVIGVEIAKLNSERVRNQISADTQQAYANTLAALSQYKTAEKSSEVLQRNFNNAKTQFENGLITTTEFNDAKTKWQNQQLEIIQAKYEYVFRMKIMDVYQGRTIGLD